MNVVHMNEIYKPFTPQAFVWQITKNSSALLLFLWHLFLSFMAWVLDGIIKCSIRYKSNIWLVWCTNGVWSWFISKCDRPQFFPNPEMCCGIYFSRLHLFTCPCILCFIFVEIGLVNYNIIYIYTHTHQQ